MFLTLSRRALAAAVVAGATSPASAHIFPFPFMMMESQVVPPTGSPARGSGFLGYNHHTLDFDLDLTITGIRLQDLHNVGPNETPIQIYFGAGGEVSDDIAVDLGWHGDFFEEDGKLRLVLEEVRLGGQQGNVFSDIGLTQISLYDGLLYIQVFTVDYPDGEIRGQLPHVRFPGRRPGNPRSPDGIFGPLPPPSSAVPLALAGLLAARRRR